jgi:hypothetical protein
MSLHPRGFQEALKFLEIFWAHEMSKRETVTKISLDRLGNVTVTLGSGPELRLGRRPEERMAALEKITPLLESGERSAVEYIDLQFDNVIVKRKPGK